MTESVWLRPQPARPAPLSRERIVEAAVTLLDAHGTDGRVSLDGKKTVTVAAPKGFTKGTCRGTILAAYAGKPLRSDELPETLTADGNSGTVEPLPNFFWSSDRVIYTFRSMPRIAGGLTVGDRKTGCEPKITLVPQ